MSYVSSIMRTAVGALGVTISPVSAEQPPKSFSRVWMCGSKYAIPGGSLVDLDRPTPIKWFEQATRGWRKIITGPFFGAAVDGENRLFVWGFNAEKYVAPYIVEGGWGNSEISDIACTGDLVIVLTKKGRVYLVDPFGPVEQLMESRGSIFFSSSLPVFKKVSAGNAHIALVDSEGFLWTAGSNEFGQCGREFTKREKLNNSLLGSDEGRELGLEKSNTVDMYKSTLTRITAVSPKVVGLAAGGEHTMVVVQEGQNNLTSLFGFGDDSHIQLGLGDTRSQELPDYVPHSGMTGGENRAKLFQATSPSVKYGFYERHVRSKPSRSKISENGSTKVSVVVAGSDFSIAGDESTGQFFCCGENRFGQCGRGLNKQQQTWGSVKLPRDSKVSEISCGSAHCVARLEDGSVWSWGKNREGQLGTGSRAPACPPVPIHGSKVRGPLMEDIITPVGRNASEEELVLFKTELVKDSVSSENLLVGNEKLLPEISTPMEETQLKREILTAVDKSRAELIMNEKQQKEWIPSLVHAGFNNTVIVMRRISS